MQEGIQFWLIRVRPAQPRSFSSPQDVTTSFELELASLCPTGKPEEVTKGVGCARLKAFQVPKGQLSNISFFFLQLRISYCRKTVGQASILGYVKKKKKQKKT